MKHATREDVEKILSEIENDDENLSILEEAMEYYCGTWDKCEGYKHAILETIRDQYDNHASEALSDDLDKLSEILNKTTVAKKYKIEIDVTNKYIIDVLAKDEQDARDKATEGFAEIKQNRTEHYHQVDDSYEEIVTTYDVTNTDDPFSPINK